jgi:hypothetical protein
MQLQPLIISFPDSSTAEGNRLAGALADALRDVTPEIEVEPRRDRPDTQDFGASLAIVLGTTAVTAVARGIAAWLARNSGAQIEIQRHGKVVLRATHLDSRDIPRIVQALSQQ